MIVSPSEQLVFLCQPRTGSKAASRALLAIGWRQVGIHHHSLDTRLITPETIVMSTIRNHFDWLGSMWRQWMSEPFAKFINRLVIHDMPREDHFVPFVQRRGDEYAAFWKYLPLTTHVLRYERLQEDLSDTLSQRIRLPEEMREAPRDYRRLYDAGTRGIVNRAFYNEIRSIT